MSSGIQREFYVAFSQDLFKKKPVLFAFHGGGGTAYNAEKQYGFASVACKEGFVVIYPQGINRQWNDGRVAPAKGNAYDDVQFVKDILDTLPAICPGADTSRFFSTGISNGGFFSIYLAYRLNRRVVAIAPVCASIPRDLENSFSLGKPIPMLLIAGTSDPLVKYNGGWVGFRNQDKGRGYSMPIDWTVNRWISMTGTDPTPKKERLPDLDPADDCQATKFIYEKDGREYIVFIKVMNGGHAWPGGRQYLPPGIIGRLCNDFSATKMILAFFDNFRNH